MTQKIKCGIYAAVGVPVVLAGAIAVVDGLVWLASLATRWVDSLGVDSSILIIIALTAAILWMLWSILRYACLAHHEKRRPQ